MNIREFAKLVASKVSPAERSMIVKKMIDAVILPVFKPKKASRMQPKHSRVGNARYVVRRRQKDSRKEQQRKGLYRRAC